MHDGMWLVISQNVGKKEILDKEMAVLPAHLSCANDWDHTQSTVVRLRTN